MEREQSRKENNYRPKRRNPMLHLLTKMVKYSIIKAATCLSGVHRYAINKDFSEPLFFVDDSIFEGGGLTARDGMR